MRRMWSFWMPAWDDDGQLVTDPQPLITRKKVILKNDCIHHVVDIYHI
jgi:3-phenylpropionate/cinnamic acid dioxygenase small subunit